jgi:phosphoglycolate phosphatase-like HAD superfamily hydrolase
MKVIAVDFDGTLCEDNYPAIGKPYDDVIARLKAEQDRGAKLILWTCRTGNILQAALEWCKNKGIRFDAINENLPDMISRFGNNPRKIGADEYWDDKAMNVVSAEPQDEYLQVVQKLYEIYRMKNADYGDSFRKVRGIVPNAILVRLYDKLFRLETLLKGAKRQVKDESVRDTLMDLANYAIMEVMEGDADEYRRAINNG